MENETYISLSFEAQMTRLEEIVKLLERGDAPLNESLSLYEEGAALLAACNKALDEAEQKVLKLKKSVEGEPIEMPFDEQEI